LNYLRLELSLVLRCIKSLNVSKKEGGIKMLCFTVGVFVGAGLAAAVDSLDSKLIFAK